jgi:eukaryotic translation initiation factor 2C
MNGCSMLVVRQDVEAKVKEVNKALIIVMSTMLGSGSVPLKANKFFMTSGHNDLGASLCIIRGYFCYVRPGIGHTLPVRQ